MKELVIRKELSLSSFFCGKRKKIKKTNKIEPFKEEIKRSTHGIMTFPSFFDTIKVVI